MERLNDGMAQSGETFFAMEQTAGRGQREKIWQSEPGQNIMMSVVFIPQSPILLNSFQFSAKIALVVRSFIQNLLAAEVKIKWPNDLMINDRKAGGLLIENKYRGSLLKTSVIGIGINVNQTDFSVESKATSLKLTAQETFDPIELGSALQQRLVESFQTFNTEPVNLVLNAYHSFLYKKNESVDFKINDQIFQAHVLGVDDQGFLKVNQDGMEKKYQTGEITWMR
jgi:BirA family biotin operon repressor/biotin-[acetyl-CoA-carboxylase] ligase